MCVFTAVALAGGATGLGAGATLATSGMLAGAGLGTALMSDMGLVSSSMSMMQSKQQGDSQAKMYEYQNQVLQQQNDLATSDRLREAERITSTQIAQFGALGTEFNSNAVNAVSNTAYDTTMDIFNNNYSTQAQISANTASGKNAKQAGNTKAATTLLDFGFKAGQIYA